MHIKINENWFFIDEHPVIFPIDIAQFEQNFGALRKTETKVNHICTQDELGWVLYSKDGKWA